MKRTVAVISVAAFVLVALTPLLPSHAQFIDRIVRPCSSGAVTQANVIANPNSSGNINVTPCTGGSLTVNGVPVIAGGLPDPGSNGFVVRTAASTVVARTLGGSNGISVSNGTGVAGNPDIAGVNAAADGATKGVSAFNANDFNAAAGVITLDYTNGQAASALLKGYLTSADWSTFNSKAPLDSPVFTTLITTPVINGGSAANDDITIQGTSNATRTTSYVNLQPNGGNVGIGTTLPDTLLDLSKSNAGQTTLLKIRNSRGGANDTADIDFTNTSTTVVMSRIGSLRTNAVSSGDSDILFSTQGSGSLGEKLRIKGSGSVGIGTTNPGALLQIGNPSTLTGTLGLANAGSAFLTTIQAGNAAAARTYTWPTNFGAAGAALTDAAGNGTLSWVVPSAGVTNSAGANIVPISDGTNLGGGDASTQITANTTTDTIALTAATAININSKGGVTTIGDVDGEAGSTKLTIDDANVRITVQGAFTPQSAAGANLGSAPLPFFSAFVGGDANNSTQIVSVATANRVATLPDATGTILLSTVATVDKLLTTTNCADSAGAAACGSASAGSFVVDAAGTSTVVSTTAVTANSQIFVFFDASLGTRLGITCNATVPTVYGITARTAGTSFTLGATAPAANPACFSYLIVN